MDECYVFKLKFARGENGKEETRRYGFKGVVDRDAVYQSLYERTAQVFGLEPGSFELNAFDGTKLDTLAAFRGVVSDSLLPESAARRDDKGRIVIVLFVSLKTPASNGYSVAYSQKPRVASSSSSSSPQPQAQPQRRQSESAPESPVRDAWSSVKTLLNQFVNDFNAHMLDTFGDQSRPFELALHPSGSLPATPENIAALNDQPVIHRNVFCDQCLRTIAGTRYKCIDCSNYDMCGQCFASSDRIHRAGHRFKLMFKPFEESGQLATRQADVVVVSQPRPEGVVHPATCDVCNKSIRGTRYKCQNCPDYDACSSCYGQIASVHPGHGFAAIRHPSDYSNRGQASDNAVHLNIRCDGCGIAPIRGVRYKCTDEACPDYDLCQNCEADPTSTHDRAHVLLKMRSPRSAVQTGVAVARSMVQPVPVPAVADQFDQGNDAPVVTEKLDVRPDLNHAHQDHIGGAKTGLTEDAVSKASEMAAIEPVKLGATWIADVTLEDGAQVAPGSIGLKIWSVINTGNVVWPDGVHLVRLGGSALQHGSVPRVSPAPPGYAAEISVEIKAPEEDGSYTEMWRLADADGNQFGDRLWIEIAVISNDCSGSNCSKHVPSSSSLSGSSLVIAPSISMDKAASAYSASVVSSAPRDSTADSTTDAGADSAIDASSDESDDEDDYLDSDLDDADDFVVLSNGGSSGSDSDV